MNIQALKAEDIERIHQIYQEYYSNDFEFPDFFHNFLCSFVVKDDCDGIVLAGGLKLVVEATLVTNKGFSVRKRRKALFMASNALAHIAAKNDYTAIYAFANDKNWAAQLKRKGFVGCNGEALVIHL